MIRERRVLISKHMAKLELEGKMTAMKLSKPQQDEFFRRYDMFEKKAFRTSNGFHKPRGYRSMSSLEQGISTTSHTFYKQPSRQELSLKESLIDKPFERNVNNFKIRRSNPAYRSVSAQASLDNMKVVKPDDSECSRK